MNKKFTSLHRFTRCPLHGNRLVIYHYSKNAKGFKCQKLRCKILFYQRGHPAIKPGWYWDETFIGKNRMEALHWLKANGH